MERKNNSLLPFRLPLGLISLASLFLLCSCATTAPNEPETAPGPDRAEMAKRSEIKSELNKVFEPIDEKSELLESR
ncbi:hypothetical protein [Puniceicoccus vermicola]|uniref:Uncharacterized protein n=1 Tax=Puniceicoccus vermicola TaxID=388746 RepID=A0A7X1AV36_9BACT|nr:hypothetical protein [Puniceicoccus vermicola]MBC2600264.1 hypothetical protein [Puniceicoccus vermicola]